MNSEKKEKINVILEKLSSYKLYGKPLTRDKVLLNPLRARIFENIKQEPDISLMELKETIKINLSALIWHLTILKKFGFITRGE